MRISFGLEKISLVGPTSTSSPGPPSDKQTGIVNFSDTPHLAARDGVIHLPIVAGPIAVMYNIGNSKPLYLSPATVAGIFGGLRGRDLFCRCDEHEH